MLKYWHSSIFSCHPYFQFSWPRHIYPWTCSMLSWLNRSKCTNFLKEIIILSIPWLFLDLAVFLLKISVLFLSIYREFRFLVVERAQLLVKLIFLWHLLQQFESRQRSILPFKTAFLESPTSPQPRRLHIPLTLINRLTVLSIHVIVIDRIFRGQFFSIILNFGIKSRVLPIVLFKKLLVFLNYKFPLKLPLLVKFSQLLMISNL